MCTCVCVCVGVCVVDRHLALRTLDSRCVDGGRMFAFGRDREIILSEKVGGD